MARSGAGVLVEAIDGGTRVTLEHRGWDKVAFDVAIRNRETKRWGWASILGWYKEWTFWALHAEFKAGSRSVTQP